MFATADQTQMSDSSTYARREGNVEHFLGIRQKYNLVYIVPGQAYSKESEQQSAHAALVRSARDTEGRARIMGSGLAKSVSRELENLPVVAAGPTLGCSREPGLGTKNYQKI